MTPQAVGVEVGDMGQREVTAILVVALDRTPVDQPPLELLPIVP